MSTFFCFLIALGAVRLSFRLSHSNSIVGYQVYNDENALLHVQASEICMADWIALQARTQVSNGHKGHGSIWTHRRCCQEAVDLAHLASL